MEELCGNIFNSVFVHRLKDSQETVRALCTRHIGNWLPLNPAKYYKDDYLKYIGWMCFDYSAGVRKEAVRSIGKLLKVRVHQRPPLIMMIPSPFPPSTPSPSLSRLQ